jgi:hypothetical protein
MREKLLHNIVALIMGIQNSLIPIMINRINIFELNNIGKNKL